jgi:hypothetical protein
MVVKGGCTSVIGCRYVVQLYIPFFIGVCYACDEAFFEYNLATNGCDCKEGWIIGELCTSIVGCSATQLVNGKVVCTFCNAMMHLVAKDGVCVCTQGY